MTGPLPPVRGVEVVPTEVDGQQMFVLHDPTGLAAGDACVSAPALFLMSLLDGARDVEAVRAEVRRQAGQDVPAGLILDLVRKLDAGRFLDSPAFHAHRDREVRAFAEAPVRPAALAGRSYPADPRALGSLLEGYFVEPGGPGARDGTGGPAVRGVLAPHLDFPRGRLGYAHAYRALAAGGPPSLVVVLGVAHASPEDPFVATPKDFATPFGPVETDREALAVVQREAGDDLRAFEWVHRGEHSAEFQAVWLRHCFPPAVAPRLRILPLLVSSFHRFVESGGSPEADPRIAGVLAGLRKVLAEAGPGARVVGGVDLSHVGPRYGDPVPVTPAQRGEIEAFDRRALQAALRGDGPGWFAAVAAEQDRTRICGFSAIYSFCRLLAGVPGTLLRYGQADDEATGSIVGYCAAAYASDSRAGGPAAGARIG